ncbi:MAG: Hpt domain-containing protein [Ferruginibacter sp.]
MENPNNNATIAEELYNLSMLEEMDDEEYLVEVLTIFLKEAQLELKEMREALHSRKPDLLSQKAHRMKSSAGVIQAEKLMEYLHSIEMLGRGGTINDELTSLVENTRQHYNLIELALKKHLKDLK